ncbi:GtrA family protein [Cytobacillus gottheilii]|uniref:GtrA family protein n=1 Tax=Cytobacillus gottheilii TaxID=859144 RepID=A0ABX8FCJ0_9BACI|nr:GtrA family protein [Cytobacillus gottheilii]QVY62090.1 GtrA family protein [Cytobacillus gottheilii]
MLLQRDLIIRFLKYSLVGCISVGVYFLSVFIFIEKYQWDPVIGSAAAFIIMTIVSFLINIRYTFNSRFTQRKLVRFLLVSLVGFLLNVILIFFIVHILSFHYFIGELVTVLVIPLVNFLLNNYWTFQGE